LTEGVLASAAEEWRDRFADLPSPRIALIVGGGTKRRPFTGDMAAELGGAASQMASAAGGSLLVSTSRREAFSLPPLEVNLACSVPSWIHPPATVGEKETGPKRCRAGFRATAPSAPALDRRGGGQ